MVIKIGEKWHTDIEMPCDGSYECATPDKPRPHKHRRRLAVSVYKSVAQEKENEMLRARRAARGDVGPDISWADFKARYAKYSATKHPTTHYKDMLVFKKLEKLRPIKYLKDLSLEYLSGEFKNDLKKSWNPLHPQPNGPNAINRDITAIKAALRKAMEWDLIRPIKLELIEPFPVPKGRLRFFSLSEFEMLYNDVSPYLKIVVMLGFYAGLRRAEIVHLPWSGVDFERNRIHIAPTGSFIPKDYERRTIPMAPTLRKFLQSLPRRSEYVLSNDGVRYLEHTTGKMFVKACKRLGLKNASIVTLRHSFGSHLAMKGVPIPTIQKYMGHSNPRTTYIYMHLSPEHMASQLDAMPAIAL